MAPAGGKRYLTSTAVFLNEVIKLGVSLTMALYDVSKTAPPSMPATSLFFLLTSAVFSGDSWKLAIPAGLDVLSNSLQYIALSNLRAATFQVTFQMKFLTTAVFALMLLKRNIAPRKWALLLLLLVGVALVQLPDVKSHMLLHDDSAHLHLSRSLQEWKAVKGAGAKLHKRSATYEGIEEDMLTADPHLNPTVGLLATIGASVASGLASTYFEKVLKDSSASTSLWVRNVQLAVYSIFPALFIGVLFRDGERIATGGFFQGYNWAVWSTVIVQALGGVFSAFYVIYAQRDARGYGTTASILLSTIGSIWLFDFEVTAAVCCLLLSSCYEKLTAAFNSSSLGLLLYWLPLTITETPASTPGKPRWVALEGRLFGLIRTKRTPWTKRAHPFRSRQTTFSLNSLAHHSCLTGCRHRDPTLRAPAMGEPAPAAM